MVLEKESERTHTPSHEAIKKGLTLGINLWLLLIIPKGIIHFIEQYSTTHLFSAEIVSL